MLYVINKICAGSYLIRLCCFVFSTYVYLLKYYTTHFPHPFLHLNIPSTLQNFQGIMFTSRTTLLFFNRSTLILKYSYVIGFGKSKKCSSTFSSLYTLHTIFKAQLYICLYVILHMHMVVHGGLCVF